MGRTLSTGGGNLASMQSPLQCERVVAKQTHLILGTRRLSDGVPFPSVGNPLATCLRSLHGLGRYRSRPGGRRGRRSLEWSAECLPLRALHGMGAGCCIWAPAWIGFPQQKHGLIPEEVTKGGNRCLHLVLRLACLRGVDGGEMDVPPMCMGARMNSSCFPDHLPNLQGGGVIGVMNRSLLGWGGNQIIHSPSARIYRQTRVVPKSPTNRPPKQPSLHLFGSTSRPPLLEPKGPTASQPAGRTARWLGVACESELATGEGRRPVAWIGCVCQKCLLHCMLRLAASIQSCGRVGMHNGTAADSSARGNHLQQQPVHSFVF